MSLPPDHLAALVHDTAQRGRVRANDAAAVSLYDLLVSVGLHPIILKGPATRALLGAAGEVRPSTDIDVLIGPSELRRARAVLRASGYTQRKGVHADTWSRPGSTDVDLHWTLPRVSASPTVVWELADSSRVDLPCAGSTISVLSPGAMVVHLALHVTLHPTSEAVERPLEDLRGAVRSISADELTQATRIAHLWGCSPSVAAALQRANLPEAAEAFGPAHVSPHAPDEQGWLAFVGSSVHWRERLRRTQRVTQLWLTFHAGRLSRFVRGTSQTNRRWANARRDKAQK